MRLKKYLVDGLVGYQGDSRAKGDYADSESAAMEKERTMGVKNPSKKMVLRKDAIGTGTAETYASKMSLEDLQKERKEIESALSDAEGWLGDLMAKRDIWDEDIDETEIKDTKNDIERLKAKAKALRTAISIKKKKGTEKKKGMAAKLSGPGYGPAYSGK